MWRAVGAMDGGAADVSLPADASVTPAVEAPSTSGGGARVAIVTATALRLRADPSTRHDPMRLLPQGTRLEVIEAAGAWYRVRVGGDEGFVHGDHIAEG